MLAGAVLYFSAILSPDTVVAPGAKLEKLSGGFSFTEGPAVDSKGNIYFTDQPNDRILKWTTDGKLETFLEPAGRSNGLCIDNKGRLWACADGKFELWRIDIATKKTEVILSTFKGKELNGPNDIWVRPDGGAYFTDPYYQRPYWTRKAMEQDSQQVYFLPANGRVPVRVTQDFVQPNGIVGSADGKRLFVADIGAGKTYSFTIQRDGTLDDKKLFCSQGSDGMTMDDKGNLYLTGQGVSVYDRTGAKIDQIDVPEDWTANVCFGGKDRKTLFITASKGLYSIKTKNKGSALQ